MRESWPMARAHVFIAVIGLLVCVVSVDLLAGDHAWRGRAWGPAPLLGIAVSCAAICLGLCTVGAGLVGLLREEEALRHVLARAGEERRCKGSGSAKAFAASIGGVTFLAGLVAAYSATTAFKAPLFSSWIGALAFWALCCMLAVLVFAVDLYLVLSAGLHWRARRGQEDAVGDVAASTTIRPRSGPPLYRDLAKRPVPMCGPAAIAGARSTDWFSRVGREEDMRNEVGIVCVLSWEEACAVAESRASWKARKAWLAELMENARNASTGAPAPWSDTFDQRLAELEMLRRDVIRPAAQAKGAPCRRNIADLFLGREPRALRAVVRPAIWDLRGMLLLAYSPQATIEGEEFAEQARWFGAGHFPCGWIGDWPRGKRAVY